MPDKNNTAERYAVIWDLPLRVFHWLLLVAVVGSIVSSRVGDNFWHEKSGITVAGLVVFRLIWGIVGSHHARFSNFLVGPMAVLAYIRWRVNGARDHAPGHGPTGAWATMVILAFLVGMASLGLMSNDDVLYEGPLVAWVGSFTDTASTLHRRGEWFLFGLIGLHLAAIVFYRLGLKIRLLPAMIHGGRDTARPPVSARRQVAGMLLLITVLGVAHGLGMIGDRYY